MINTTTQYIIIGKFGRPHGLKGWISLYAESDDKENILQYQPWLINTKSDWQAVEVEDVAVHHKNILVRIKDIETQEQARTFTDKTIAILRDQLPKLDQDDYYWADLEGLTVINLENKTLGKIIHLFRTGANDVMIIEGDRKQLIPFIQEEVIQKIDLENRTMQVNWDAEF